MARCKACGNTINFNVWCTVRKVLEVEIDENDELLAVVGESEDESMNEAEIAIADGDIAFSMVGCAWCGSGNIEYGKGDVSDNAREQ